MPLSFLTAPRQDRGSFYYCSWDVAIVFQYTKTRCPDGPCVSPWTAPSCTTEGFLAIVTQLQSQGTARVWWWGVGGGCGLCGFFEKMCEIGVWVLRVLSQLGVYCAEGWAPYWHPWSPPLTQKLCSAPCVFFCQTLTTFSPSLFASPLFSSHFALSHSQGIWRVLLSPVWFSCYFTDVTEVFWRHTLYGHSCPQSGPQTVFKERLNHQ